MTPVIRCTLCGNPTTQRPREALADKISEAVGMAAHAPEDWERRFQILSMNLVWIEAELRGRCPTCMSEEVLIEGGERAMARVIPIDEMRDRRGGGL